MDHGQEVEVTLKVKVKYPPVEEMLHTYGHADVALAVAEDWENNPESIFENQDWTLVAVNLVPEYTEPTLEDHTIKALEETDG